MSKIFRLLTAYATIKYRESLIQAQQYAFPSLPQEEHVCKANTLIIHALQIGCWGSDFHLFPLSLLLDRPIFTYVYFYTTNEDRVRTLMLTVFMHLLRNFFRLLQVPDNMYSGAVVYIEPCSCQVMLQRYHTYHWHCSLLIVILQP